MAGPARGPGGNFYGIIFLPSATDAVKLTKVEAFTEERTSIFGAVSAHLTTITLPEEDILIQNLRYHLLTAVFWILKPEMLRRFGWGDSNQIGRVLLPQIVTGWTLHAG